MRSAGPLNQPPDITKPFATRWDLVRLAAICAALTKNYAGRSNQLSPGSVACAKCQNGIKLQLSFGWVGFGVMLRASQSGRDMLVSLVALAARRYVGDSSMLMRCYVAAVVLTTLLSCRHQPAEIRPPVPLVPGSPLIVGRLFWLAPAWTTDAPRFARLDSTTMRSAPFSARITHPAAMASPDSGSTYVQQSVIAQSYRGKRVRYSAWIKLLDVRDAGHLVYSIETDTLPLRVGRDQMEGRRPTGTRDWEEHSLVLDVPTEAAVIHVGFGLMGSGTVWLDDARIEVVDDTVAPTQPDNGRRLPWSTPESERMLRNARSWHEFAEPRPRNLSFDAAPDREGRP